MMIDIEAAKSLAVRYHAFASADFENSNEIAIWGEMLLEAQAETGIEMYPTNVLKRWVREARAA